MHQIICNNETLILSHCRAVYWPAQKALLLADMHLGKSGYFRSQGIAIPSTVMMDDLKRLSHLIHTHQPQKIIVAGDMFHHNYNADIEIFCQWRQQYAHIQIILVPGNHDKLLQIDYKKLGIEITDREFIYHPFTIIHHMKTSPDGAFTISGHVHPGYMLQGRARQQLRLPCYIVSSKHLLLPAFSAFTGLYTGYETPDENSYYVIGNEKVYSV